MRAPMPTDLMWILKALAISAVVALTPGLTFAADLEGDAYAPPENRYSAAPDRYDYSRPEPQYEQPAYREDERPYHPSAAPDQYDEAPPPYSARHRADNDAQPGCLSRWRIRNSLSNAGWVDMKPVGRGGPAITIKARRAETGNVFLLDVDTCTGEVLAARRHYLRPFSAYDDASPRQPRRLLY